MKTNIIATVVLATLSLGVSVAEAGGSRHHRRSSCDYRPPVVVAPPVCYDRSPSYYRQSSAGYGWGYVAPVRPAPVYRSYNSYGSGYVESRRTVCRPTYVPPPCPTYYPRPSCGTGYSGYRGYGGTRGSISFRF